MTHNELAQLRQRVAAAELWKTRLVAAEALLQKLQGSLACEPYEAVEAALTQTPRPACDVVTGYFVRLKDRGRAEVDFDIEMPAEVSAAMREATRALVRWLRTTYEAC